MGSGTVSARDVELLLLKKHEDDVWASEIAVRPHGARRIDFWAMAKSHSRPCTTGYEIKVSRADFMGDNKWMEYLPCCNRLYMVCPHGMIDKDEVMPEAGLMWVSKNKDKLTTRKKAPYRTEGVNPTFVYRQLLMRLSTPLSERTFDDPLLIARVKQDQQLLGKWLSNQVGEHLRGRELKIKQDEMRLARLEPYVEVLDALGLSGYGIRSYQRRLGDVDTDAFVTAFQQIMQKLEPVTRDKELETLCYGMEEIIKSIHRVRQKAHDLQDLFVPRLSERVNQVTTKKMELVFDQYREVCARTAAGLATDEDLEKYKELRDKIKELKGNKDGTHD